MIDARGWDRPDERALSRSPLVNVVWQLRFPQTPVLSEGRSALGFQQLLDRDTRLAPVAAPATRVVGASPLAGQATPSTEQLGWRMSAPDGATHVTVNDTTLTVETTRYGTWAKHFQPWVNAAVHALGQVAKPDLVLRIGMRYINAVFGGALGRGPFENLADLQAVGVPALLGFGADETFPATVEGIQGQQVLRAGDLITHLQHATVVAENGEVGLLLDLDTYVERAVAFSVDDVLTVADHLHVTGLATFQHCITPDAWQAMGPTERGAD
jgi:uncharacterized protein (TIGR04255 family)